MLPFIIKNRVLWLVSLLFFIYITNFITNWIFGTGIFYLDLVLHQDWLVNYLLGILIGAIWYTSMFTTNLLRGSFKINIVPKKSLLKIIQILLLAFITQTFVALSEEIIFRGYLFRIIPFSSIILLLIAGALIFAIAHFPHYPKPIRYWFFIFVSGILFGIGYYFTGSLWFPIGIHFGVNFFYFVARDMIVIENHTDSNFLLSTIHARVTIIFCLITLFLAQLL